MPLEQKLFITTIRICDLQLVHCKLWQENASRNPFGCQPEGFNRSTFQNDFLSHFLTMSRNGPGQVASTEVNEVMQEFIYIERDRLT